MNRNQLIQNLFGAALIFAILWGFWIIAWAYCPACY